MMLRYAKCGQASNRTNVIMARGIEPQSNKESDPQRRAGSTAAAILRCRGTEAVDDRCIDLRIFSKLRIFGYQLKA